MANSPRLPTGTVTFLFTDIEGSTRLWEAHPDAMRDALAAHDAIFREIVPHHNGVIFKTIGDAICAAFERPDDALRAAVDSQRRLTTRAWSDDIGVFRVRMGIHTGMAQERDDDYFGPAVNRVARFMSIAHGGQILVSGATRELLRHLDIDVTLRELGEHWLKDLKEPEPAYQVLAEGLATEFPSLTSLDARPNNLPAAISSFVGRRAELQELRSAVSSHRLVSIVGPGGIGKTRIAVHLAGEVLANFRDGAWLVELAGITDSALVAQTVADALGIREDPTSPVREQLLFALAHKRMLVVLDNSEHLLEEVATLARRLLSACPKLHVVVTSREPLHLEGERVVRLNALELSGDGGSSDLRSDGMLLFIDRALAVRPDLSIDADAEQRVARICVRLEGIPLAIELAAARAATFSLAQLEERLSDRLATLVSRDRTRSERQRTLRAAIEWSFHLLSGEERHFARTVATFTGSFSEEAATAVADATSVDELIESLVNKSFLSVQPSDETHRYLLLDVVRQYLLEEVAPHDADALPTRHFSYYAAVAGRGHNCSTAAQQHRWMEQIGAEINNLRAALEWSFARSPNDAGRFVTDLCLYFQRRGHIAEGTAWLMRILESTRLDTGMRAGMLRRAATFATIRNDYDTARDLCAQAKSAFEQTGDRGGIAEASHVLAIIDQLTGDSTAATEHFLLALAGFRAVQNADAELKTLLNLTSIALAKNDLGWAEALLEEGAEIETRLVDEHLAADLMRIRGSFQLRRGQLVEAAASYERALGVKRAIGSRFDTSEILNSLAAIYARQGAPERATAAARECLAIALDLDVPLLIIAGFEAFCEIALAIRAYADAADYLALAVHLRERNSYRHPGHLDLEQAALELQRIAPSEMQRTDRDPEGWIAVARGLSGETG